MGSLAYDESSNGIQCVIVKNDGQALEAWRF